MRKDVSVPSEDTSQFEKDMAYALNADNAPKDMIKQKVIDFCIESELFSHTDLKSRTKKYQWVEEVTDINIKIMNLLELSESGNHPPESFDELNSRVDAQVTSIFKDIVRRIIQTPMHFPK